EMQRSVEQRECGPFAGALERRPRPQAPPPVHVKGRQRLQAPPHLGEGQARQVPRLESLEPAGNGIGVGRHEAMICGRAGDGDYSAARSLRLVRAAATFALTGAVARAVPASIPTGAAPFLRMAWEVLIIP